MAGLQEGKTVTVTRETVEAALADALTAEPAVVAAYLFGSLARGTAGPLSDVDVALLIRDLGDGEAVCGRTMDELARRLRTSSIDVISLTEAPMPLRYRVVRDGALVVCRDRRVVERFITDTVLHYLDFEPLRNRAFEVMRQAILQNR
ncbi:MAG: hypothetical protein A3G76_14640 [Acidobacteria bacterium RIFCSPLOWO2_12_FULL_65_11]|nr:MAG: hypothetical protein A3H95_06115 [Acidobacteria bacterium RIFCSPLOWO2_02_FULL_64_15]OFW28515.1 MAG: hypothetical protein A3G76_14640 [Acidobacteria bacterium RIFCSPLOWO2_12_FULL_65_11]